MVSGQQLKFKQASAKVRAEGITPFTKAFGARMKQLLSKGSRRKSSTRSTSKRSKPSKKRRSASKGSSRSTRSSGSTKMAAKKGGQKKGTSGMTRTKKFLLGFGIGAAVSTAAGLARTPELEAAGPIIDAVVGAGVEGQVGTAVPRLIRQILLRTGGGFGNGRSNGLALEGA